MTTQTAPALDPWTTDELHFVPMPAARAVVLFPKPEQQPSFGRWDGAASYVTLETEATQRRLYQSPALGWRGSIFCAEQDEPRLLLALQAAEGWILFVAWLKRCGS